MFTRRWIGKFGAAALAAGIMLGGGFAHAQQEDWGAVKSAAKAEGALLVYSTTSRTAKAAEAFSAMTGITVEVVRLGEQDLIQRAYQEARAGRRTSVDMIVVEDWVAARELLSSTGYFVNYVPPTARELFAERHQDPLVLGFINRIFGYNTDKHPDGDPFVSVWDLTTDAFRGRVMIRDVAITGEHQNAFTEWVRRADELEAAYERRFGEPLVMTEANAGLEWIKRFLENDPIIMTSDTRISEAVGAPGQEDPPYGMFYVYSKHRDIPLQDLRVARTAGRSTRRSATTTRSSCNSRPTPRTRTRPRCSWSTSARSKASRRGPTRPACTRPTPTRCPSKATCPSGGGKTACGSTTSTSPPRTAASCSTPG